jgi:hypothetical protein
MAVKTLETIGMPDWQKELSIGFVDMVLDSWWKGFVAEVKYRSKESRANQE